MPHGVKCVPQRLKPLLDNEFFGTAEAVPLSKARFAAIPGLRKLI